MSTATRANRGRWALSFADLCLLLLGFFVLLQSDQQNGHRAVQALGTYFGAIEAPQLQDLAATQLFAPGDALLTDEGRARLLAAARALNAGKAMIEIQSFGGEGGAQRFDAWDLAAARLGAVARALQGAGIPQQRIRIAGLAEAPEGRKDRAGQTIRLLVRAPE